MLWCGRNQQYIVIILQLKINNFFNDLTKKRKESACGIKTGFLDDSVVKNPPANAGDLGSIPGWGRSPREGNGNPFQCSCLEKPTDRGAWQAMAHMVAKVIHDLATKLPPKGKPKTIRVSS